MAAADSVEPRPTSDTAAEKSGERFETTADNNDDWLESEAAVVNVPLSKLTDDESDEPLAESVTVTTYVGGPFVAVAVKVLGCEAREAAAA